MTDIEARVRAMTPRQKRDHLRAAGWRSSDWLCHQGSARPAERWAPSRDAAYDHTLGEAIRAGLHADQRQHAKTI